MATNNARAVIDTITRVANWPPASLVAKQRARPSERVLNWVHALPRSETDRLVQRSRRLVTSAHAENVPLVFNMRGEDARLSIGLGTCAFESNGAAASIEQRADVLDRLLRFAYPGAELSREPSPTQIKYDWACLWVGVPGSGQLARFARAVTGLRFDLQVIAQRLDGRTTAALLDAAGDEQRTFQATIADSNLPEPTVSLLLAYLERFIKRMQAAATTGGWRVAVHMMTDTDAAAACRAIYRAAYGSSTPGQEPLALWSGPDVSKLAVQWAIPDAPSVHPLVPFPWQTVLSSDELASLICLPDVELPGFRLLDQPSFDIVPPSQSGAQKEGVSAAISIGNVVSEGRPTPLEYKIGVEQLTKHCFIAGTTGSGKTNTVFHILRQLAATGTPFLVIEPTKTEYRALIREPEFKKLRVYTLGDELGIPMRLNPLAPEPGAPIAEHIDLLKGVIGASIGAWNPLPQILEKALHRVYREAGWDIVNGTNYRVLSADVPASAYPTLVDLLEASVAVTRELGYSERVGPDIEAALRVRLESLLTGGRGRMLATSEHQPFDALLAQPTILELESIADEDDCAFVMGVLLIRIVEHLRIRGNTPGCRIVVVIEEAHRLLGETQRGNSEFEGNARFKAVSMFANLLSEVRAYGAGFIICDQSPSKLTRDVLKNTNTKIAHRIVSADDAGALAGSMRLGPAQAGALASLAPGIGAVFSGGDDYPVLTKVPLNKRDAAWPTTDELKRLGQGVPSDATAAGSIVRHAAAAWDDALQATPEFVEAMERVLNVLVAAPGAVGEAWAEAREAALRRLPQTIDRETSLRTAAPATLAGILRRHGQTYGWPYEELEKLRKAGDAVLQALMQGTYEPFANADIAFRGLSQRLHQLAFGPLSSCRSSCASKNEVECVFRASACRLGSEPAWNEEWQRAAKAPANESSQKLADVAVRAGDAMIGVPRSSVAPLWFSRAAFCFAQHMVAKDMRNQPPRVLVAANASLWDSILNASPNQGA